MCQSTVIFDDDILVTIHYIQLVPNLSCNIVNVGEKDLKVKGCVLAKIIDTICITIHGQHYDILQFLMML